MSRLFTTVILVIAASVATVAFAKMHDGRSPCAEVRQAIYRPALTQYASDTGESGFSRVPYIIMSDEPAKPVSPYPLIPSLPTDASPKQVMLGDYAAAAMEWMMPILAPIIAGFVVDLLIKARTWLGQSTTDAQREKLLQMAQNGVNLATHKLAPELVGKFPVQTRSAIMAQAVDYVQAHGADTIKALGLDPTDAKAVEAIQGHVATILANKEAAALPKQHT